MSQYGSFHLGDKILIDLIHTRDAAFVTMHNLSSSIGDGEARIGLLNNLLRSFHLLRNRSPY